MRDQPVVNGELDFAWPRACGLLQAVASSTCLKQTGLELGVSVPVQVRRRGVAVLAGGVVDALVLVVPDVVGDPPSDGSGLALLVDVLADLLA